MTLGHQVRSGAAQAHTKAERRHNNFFACAGWIAHLVDLGMCFGCWGYGGLVVVWQLRLARGAAPRIDQLLTIE